MNVKEFDKQNGESIVEGNWLFFETGASRELQSTGAAILCSPPEDPYKCALQIEKFFRVKLQLAIQGFSMLKVNLTRYVKTNLASGECGMAPTQAQLTKLRNWRTRVKNYQTRLKKATQNVEDNKPERMVARENVDAENRENCSAFLSKLQKVEI